MENTIETIIRELHEKYQSCGEGALADYIPELTNADPNWFAICVFTVDGHSYEIGDHDKEFTIQSVSKAFTYGMILDDLGFEEVFRKIGVEPSGEAFNSISLDPDTGRPRNPMINAGAIAATGQVEGVNFDRRFSRIIKKFNSYAARNLDVDEEVYSSESTTGFRNRAIANLLRNFGIIDDPVDETVELYFKQCSILVNCSDLALMGATLANGGVNPVTKERVLKSENVDRVLSVMSSCGMYDSSGEWILKVGLPAKSGVGGGVLGILPGQLGMAVFSPLLDEKGNSVRGVKTFAELSQRFNLHLFNYPTVSDNSIRRLYKLNQAVSHRVRPQAHQKLLEENADRVTIMELQGDLFFSAMERLLRAQTEHVDGSDIFVLDLTRVGLIDSATEGLMIHVAVDLHLLGKRMWIVDPKQILTKHSFYGSAQSVRFHDSIEAALEICENDILMAQGVELLGGDHGGDDFEIFAGLDDDQKEVITGLLDRREFKRGDYIISQGDDADCIYLLQKGSESIRVHANEEDERVQTLAAYYPGVTFGDLAIVDRGRKRSADVVADEECVCWSSWWRILRN